MLQPIEYCYGVHIESILCRKDVGGRREERRRGVVGVGREREREKLVKARIVRGWRCCTWSQ